MLVLSREKNQQIVIGHGIVLTVVEIRGNKVRLGIECPRDVSVHRAEVFEAIHGKERIAEVRNAIDAGLSLAELEELFDWQDNQLVGKKVMP
jgi:carbon storage regulator